MPSANQISLKDCILVNRASRLDFRGSGGVLGGAGSRHRRGERVVSRHRDRPPARLFPREPLRHCHADLRITAEALADADNHLLPSVEARGLPCRESVRCKDFSPIPVISGPRVVCPDSRRWLAFLSPFYPLLCGHSVAAIIPTRVG